MVSVAVAAIASPEAIVQANPKDVKSIAEGGVEGRVDASWPRFNNHRSDLMLPSSSCARR
jgi:hypothetical protein